MNMKYDMIRSALGGLCHEWFALHNTWLHLI